MFFYEKKIMKIHLQNYNLHQNLELCNDLSDLGLQITFSKNDNLIKQFLMLRNNIMQNELKINELNFFDEGADFLLVVNNNQKVIAGCKFLYSQIIEGKSSSILSQEISNTDFLYHKFLTTIDTRKNLQISELSNLVIDNNYRVYSAIILQNMIAKFIKELQNKLNYCFWVTEIIRSKFYQKIFYSLKIESHISKKYLWFNSNKYPSRKKDFLCQNYISYVKFF